MAYSHAAPGASGRPSCVGPFYGRLIKARRPSPFEQHADYVSPLAQFPSRADAAGLPPPSSAAALDPAGRWGSHRPLDTDEVTGTAKFLQLSRGGPACPSTRPGKLGGFCRRSRPP